MRLALRELTPPGRGAVSILELTGTGALTRLRDLVVGGLAEGDLRLARLCVGGDVIDEALVVVLAEDRVELHLHGAPPIVERVRRALAPVSRAESVLPTTLEELAEERLATAPCEAAARILLDQVEGALRRALERILALGDEGSRAGELLRELVVAGERSRFVLEPAVVVLAGPVNAGKSTLFNALLGYERVVVNPEHGTTRDAVRERARWGDLAFDLVDTAGDRATGSGAAAAVERAGQRLGERLREAANLVLWLQPASDAGEPPVETGSLRVVRTRSDEGGGRLSAQPALSAGRDPESARRIVADLMCEALSLPRPAWIAGRAVPIVDGQREALEKAHGLATADGNWRKTVESLLDGTPSG